MTDFESDRNFVQSWKKTKKLKNKFPTKKIPKKSRAENSLAGKKKKNAEKCLKQVFD